MLELPAPHQILIARTGLGINTPTDLAPVAATTRGGLNCAGFVGEPHLACELLRHQLGGASVTVPYSGGPPAAQALAAGQVDLMVAAYEVALSLQAAGRAVPIASTGSRPAAPPFDKLPLMKDLWPAFVFDGVLGILAPPGTPPPVLRQLEQQFRQVLRDPAMRETLALAASSPTRRDHPNGWRSACARSWPSIAGWPINWASSPSDLGDPSDPSDPREPACRSHQPRLLLNTL